MEEESEGDYLRRALALKPKLGLVVGKRQLGERVLYEVADAVRSWRLAGTPREWTQDTVVELLQGTGLNNLTVTSRITRKGAATWFLRAACKEDMVALNVEEGGEHKVYYVLPTAVSRQGPAGRQLLRHEAAFVFRNETFKVAPGGAAAGDGAVTTDDRAACRLFNLTVFVVPTSPEEVPSRHGSGAFPVTLQYEAGTKGGIGHYDFLEPTDRNVGYPAVITTIEQVGSRTGGRGGGDNGEGRSDRDDSLTLYTEAGGGFKPRPRQKGLHAAGSAGEDPLAAAEDEVALTTYTSVDGRPVRRQTSGGNQASDIRKWFGPAGGRVGPDACSAASRARQLDRVEAGNRLAVEEDTETGTHANLEDVDNDFDELHRGHRRREEGRPKLLGL